MSRYLGFDAVTSGEFYFISYNTEDQSRVETVVKRMNEVGIPLWYDYGLKIGVEWETEIVNRIE